MANEFGFDVLVDDILNELASTASAEDSKQIKFDLVNKVGLPLANWYNEFKSAYDALAFKIKGHKRIKFLRQVNNVYYAENGEYEAQYLAQETLLYSRAIAAMKSGYRLLNGLRELFTGTTIKYKVVVDDTIGGKKTQVEYSLTEEQLLELSTPTLLGRIRGKNKEGTDMLALQAQFSKSMAQLQNLAIKDLSEDALYTSVMDFTGHHHLGVRATLQKSRLLEVYYYGSVINLTDVGPRYNSHFIHGVYEMSLSNTPYWQGGDVLNLQIKSTETFDLTKSTSLINQIANLKELFLNPDITQPELEAALIKIFFQKERELKMAGDAAVEKAQQLTEELVDREMKNLKTIVAKFFI